MRNPIRIKNLRLRFLPYYVLGGLAIWYMSPSPAAFATGACLVVLGAAVRSWGAGHLVKNDKLTVTGPYAWVRHPLYVGTLLVATGFAIIIGGWLTVAVLVALLPWFFLHYFPRKEQTECARLEAAYPGDFSVYRESVPALFPALQPWRPAIGELDTAEPATRWSGSRYSENNELGTLLAIIVALAFFALRTFGVS